MPDGDEQQAGLDDLPSWPLSEARLATVELVLDASLAPRQGFTDTDPLVVTTEVADAAEAAGGLALRDGEGVLIAVLDVAERRPAGAGSADVALAGLLAAVEAPRHFDFEAERMTPAETRATLAALGRDHVVGAVATRPLYRADVANLLARAEPLDAAVLILGAVGPDVAGEIDAFTRMRCYRAVLGELAPVPVVLAVAPLSHRPGDPRQNAELAAVLANYGVTEVVDLDEVDSIAADPQTLTPAEVAELLARGERLPDFFTFPAVADELAASYPRLDQRGMTIFFTGLSGSGKSTVAHALAAQLRERGGRQVTMLDGDLVRHHLSSELGFSREHRDLNIRRIGFVAAEITRAGGIAICAPIAPYDEVRRAVRAMVTASGPGSFVLVHVATPLSVCEARDRKGLYAKARAGVIPEFTGISDPYEVPTDAEITLDTSDRSIGDAVAEVMDWLTTTGHVLD